MCIYLYLDTFFAVSCPSLAMDMFTKIPNKFSNQILFYLQLYEARKTSDGYEVTLITKAKYCERLKKY